MTSSTTRRLSALAAASLLGAAVAIPAFAAGPVSVTVNGNAANLNPPPTERAGRVFVPLRGVFEQLGASVVYQSGVINATGRGHTISLQDRLAASDGRRAAAERRRRAVHHRRVHLRPAALRLASARRDRQLRRQQPRRRDQHERRQHGAEPAEPNDHAGSGRKRPRRRGDLAEQRAAGTGRHGRGAASDRRRDVRRRHRRSELDSRHARRDRHHERVDAFAARLPLRAAFRRLPRALTAFACPVPIPTAVRSAARGPLRRVRRPRAPVRSSTCGPRTVRRSASSSSSPAARRRARASPSRSARAKRARTPSGA